MLKEINQTGRLRIPFSPRLAFRYVGGVHRFGKVEVEMFAVNDHNRQFLFDQRFIHERPAMRDIL
jgi:hypothetical protein